MRERRQLVYWVIAKVHVRGRGAPARTVERLGPFESRGLAQKACDLAASRYRARPEARIDVVCDFS